MKDRAPNSDTIRAGLDGLCALALALTSAVYGNFARIPAGSVQQFLELRVTLLNVIFAALFLLAWTSCFRALGLYQRRYQSIFRAMKRVLQGCALMAGVLGLYLFITRTAGPTLRIAAIFLVTSVTFEGLRLVWERAIRLWVASRDPRVVVIVGSGRKAGVAWRQIRTRHHSTVRLLGFVDDRAVSEMAPDVADRYLGTVDQLSEILLRNVVDELVIALPTKSCYESIERAISIAEQVGVEVVYMQDLYVTTRKERTLDEPQLFTELVPPQERHLATLAVKRLLDVVGAAAGLLLLSPLFLLAAIAVRTTGEGPIFFSQERYGYRRRKFRMFKFRSMVANAPELMAQLEDQNEAEGPIFKIRHDPRITPVGRTLRTTSIDELPQLWNVLIGDMSLVGPRPMSVRDVSLFSEATLMRRFSVKPGITGLWQVSGRSDASFDQWIKFDFSYIDDWSLGLDFRILARTVSVVLKRSGAA